MVRKLALLSSFALGLMAGCGGESDPTHASSLGSGEDVGAGASPAIAIISSDRWHDGHYVRTEPPGTWGASSTSAPSGWSDGQNGGWPPSQFVNGHWIDGVVVGPRWGNGNWKNRHWSQTSCHEDKDCYDAVPAPLGDSGAICDMDAHACDLTGVTDVHCGGVHTNLTCVADQYCALTGPMGVCTPR